MLVGQTAADALELAVVALGALVCLRLGLAAAVRAVSRGTGSLADLAARAARALRPGLARRALAGVLGLAAPAAVLVPTTTAVAARPGIDLAVSPAADRHPAVRSSEPAPAQPAGRAVYVVRAGDSLWDIARRHLPAHATRAQVAHAWPSWYAANREVIGADPAHLLPGQHLRVPGRRSAGTPTQPHAAPAPTTGTTVPAAQSLDPDRR